MMRFERRLRKLEAVLTDCSGLVPYTAAWWDYWIQGWTNSCWRDTWTADSVRGFRCDLCVSPIDNRAATRPKEIDQTMKAISRRLAKLEEGLCSRG